MPRQCHGPHARPVPWAAWRDLERGDLSRAVAVPRPSRATCPVGGGSAAVKSPALPSRYHKQPACKKRPLPCRCIASLWLAHHLSNAVPQRATCPVGGGSAAVKSPALPSRYYQQPAYKKQPLPCRSIASLWLAHKLEGDKCCRSCLSDLDGLTAWRGA